MLIPGGLSGIFRDTGAGSEGSSRGVVGGRDSTDSDAALCQRKDGWLVFQFSFFQRYLLNFSILYHIICMCV